MTDEEQKPWWQTKRCPACGGRGWRLDLDERCSCNPLPKADADD